MKLFLNVRQLLSYIFLNCFLKFSEMRSYFPQKITKDIYEQKSPFAHYNNCIPLSEVTTVTILELVFFCVYVFTYVEIYNCIL